MRTRLALVPLLLLTACSSSGGSGGGTDQALQASSTPSATASSSSSARPLTTTQPTTAATAGAPGGSAATGTTGSTGTAPGGAVAKPLVTTAPGKPAVSKATAPGTYTYDSTGTVTLGSPGTPQQVSSQPTFTVSPVSGGAQRSTRHSDDTGDTDETLLVRDAGSYLSALKLTSPAFTKEFRPTSAVLLVPDPAKVGASWSWSAVSTDGKTTVTQSTKVARTETLTIGGTKVVCAVLSTDLHLSGDVVYDDQLTTWWAPAYRLPVKDHSVGKGSYNGFPFSTDITSVMRSVKPA